MLQRMARPIPAEVIFNPHWWYRNYGISFDESFYFDRALRIQNDLTDAPGTVRKIPAG